MTETPEQAATRRRWITLAELVAVAGLLIGALTLYLNWADRREDQAAKVAEVREKDVVTLSSTVADGGDRVTLTDATRQISAATVRFPAALRLAAQDAMPGPRIEAAWFADAILTLTDSGPDSATGRLPVLVTVEYWDGDTRRSATARYDLLWRTEGRLLRSRKLMLTGITLADRNPSPAALDAAWRAGPLARVSRNP